MQVGFGFRLALVSSRSHRFEKEIAHEFQLVHAFTSVPMHESFSSVHGRELVADTLEQGLDAGSFSLVSGLRVWIGTYEVELQMKVEDILRPRGGTSLIYMSCDPESKTLKEMASLPLRRRDVSRDPLDEVARVLGLDVLDLLFDLLHRDLSSVDTVDSEVSLLIVSFASHSCGPDSLRRVEGPKPPSCSWRQTSAESIPGP